MSQGRIRNQIELPKRILERLRPKRRENGRIDLDRIWSPGEKIFNGGTEVSGATYVTRDSGRRR